MDSKFVSSLFSSLFPYTTNQKSSLPGLWKYPSHRDDLLKCTPMWIKGKQEDDGAEGLWRIHDSIYDLTSFVKHHPGGAEWLEITKGTDITEAFEVCHISTMPESLLKKYYVKNAITRRNSPFTFKHDGFYRIFKTRAKEVLKDSYSGPTTNSKLIADVLVTATFVTSVLSVIWRSYMIGCVAGVLLALNTVVAHNFFHLKDNFRICYFDISFLSSREWRVSHALSHHIYTNTVLDLEVSIFEPFFQWLPYSSKTLFIRYASWVYSPIVYSVIFFGQGLIRIMYGLKYMDEPLRKRDLMPFTLPLVMLYFSGWNVSETLKFWAWILLNGGFMFGAIGLNAGHHHPEVFHDGDKPRDDMDWGLFELDAVRERTHVTSNLFLALCSFGHHALHHLLPTVDHDRLPQLYPALRQTCKEFNIPFNLYSPWEMIKGQFLQLAKVQTGVVGAHDCKISKNS